MLVPVVPRGSISHQDLVFNIDTSGTVAVAQSDEPPPLPRAPEFPRVVTVDGATGPSLDGGRRSHRPLLDRCFGRWSRGTGFENALPLALGVGSRRTKLLLEGDCRGVVRGGRGSRSRQFHRDGLDGGAILYFSGPCGSSRCGFGRRGGGSERRRDDRFDGTAGQLFEVDVGGGEVDDLVLLDVQNGFFLVASLQIGVGHGGDGGFEAYLGGLVHSGPLVVGVVVEQQIRNTLVLVELQEVLELALFGEKAEACEESPVLRQQQDCDGGNV